MSHLVILGAGTGGTIVANLAARRLSADWRVTVIDPETRHLYQPGLLFLPFAMYDESKLYRSRRSTLRSNVTWLQRSVTAIDPVQKVIRSAEQSLNYDLLVIATGSFIHPEETDGMTGDDWQKRVFDFYTPDGALKLRDALATFREGRLVVNVVDMPIKCPVAPLEFLFLADAFLRDRGVRKNVELVYATPLDGAFTKPVASRRLGRMLSDRDIRLETEFNAGRVDAAKHQLLSWDERAIDYDLLVSVPLHSGASFLSASGLGNDSSFVPTDKATLLARGYDDILVLGDATDLPASKAGSVAHFQSEIVVANLLRLARGQSVDATFDGHANCFIESGHARALLIDFNYETEPLPGKFPLPMIGPMSLLKESVFNHLGKLAFRWIYWNLLLPAYPLPISSHMTTLGKEIPATPARRVA